MISLTKIPFIGKYFAVLPLTQAPQTGTDGKAVELREMLFAKERTAPKQNAPLLSGLSMGSVFLITDYTATYRAAFDVAGLGIANFPEISLGGIFDKIIHQEGILPGYHSFGLGTALNTILGAVNLKHDFDRIAFCQSIEDSRGSLKGRISVVRDAIYATTGIVFGIFRPLAITSSIRGVPVSFQSPSLLGRVTYGFVFIGILLYAVFFSLFSVIQGVNIWEIDQLQKKLGKAKDVKEQLEILQKKLYVNPEKVRSKLEQKYEKNFEATLIQEALQIGKESLKQLMNELNIPMTNDDKLEIALKAVLSASGKDLKTQLVDLGLQLRVQKVAIKKQAKLQRILGEKGFAELCKINQQTPLQSLINRMDKADAGTLQNGKAIAEQVEKAIQSNLRLNSVLFAFNVLEVAVMLAAVIFTAGTELLVASVLMLVGNILSIMVDSYFLYQSYKGETPLANDRKLLIASTVLCLVSFFSVVALSASGVISMGIIPIAVMLVLSALWLGQNGVTWKVMNRIEKENMLKHPTLQNILEIAKKGQNDAMLREMLNNLPSGLKQMIEEALKELVVNENKIDFQKQVQQAALQVIQKVEAIKKAEMEKLRESVMPYLIEPAV